MSGSMRSIYSSPVVPPRGLPDKEPPSEPAKNIPPAVKKSP